MFELQSDQRYQMPAHFGPRPLHPGASGWYHDVTALSVSYVTDADALNALLPAPYRAAEEPRISVTYAANRKVDWLAGHGYNMIAVNAEVVFEGKEEQLEGNFCLVIWENLCDPILSGRELQGIPKVYADIPDHQVNSGNWSASASHFGHRIVELKASALREPTAEEVIAHETRQRGRNHSLGWRYMPGIGGAGHAINEATTYHSETQLREAWLAEGDIQWSKLTWEQNPTQFHFVNALADLPVRHLLPALITRGSTNLILPDQPTRIIC